MSNLFKRYMTIIQEKTNINLSSLKKIKEKKENLDINSSILNQNEINEFESALKSDDKKIVIILVGLPATGKTTLTKSIKRIFNQNDILLIDRDEILNDTAKDFGLNFDDLFYVPRDTHEQLDHPKFGKWSSNIPSPFGGWEKVYKANSTATTKLNKIIFNSVNTDKKVILIDSLYINVFQRKKIINLFKNQKEKFYTIAIVTQPLNQKKENIIKNKELVSYRTLKSLRENNPIIVTPSIIDLAFNNFEYPSKNEGFDLILNIDSIDRIFTKLLKRKIDINKIIKDSPLEKTFKNFKIRKFIDLIDKTDFDKKLNFNSGFQDHFSNQINIDNQNEENKKIIKKIQEMYPEITNILIDNGYPKYKPIDTFLKELNAFYDYKFKNIIYFYENYIKE